MSSTKRLGSRLNLSSDVGFDPPVKSPALADVPNFRSAEKTDRRRPAPSTLCETQRAVNHSANLQNDTAELLGELYATSRVTGSSSTCQGSMICSRWLFSGPGMLSSLRRRLDSIPETRTRGCLVTNEVGREPSSNLNGGLMSKTDRVSCSITFSLRFEVVVAFFVLLLAVEPRDSG